MSALPHSTTGWVWLFARANVPARRLSLTGLAALRERIEDVSPRRLAALVLRDPLLTARLFAYAAAHRGPNYVGNLTTVDGMVLTFGMTKVIEALAGAPSLESRLARKPEALEGLFEVLLRARQAARYAAEFAGHRQDREIEEIAVAGLLSDLAEMLLWCEAPEAALEIRRRLHNDHRLRSHAVQQEVLGTALHDVQLAVAQAWRLPGLLVTMMDSHHAENPRVRNVALAVNLARHSANGWDNPALPDDFTAIGALLHLDETRVRQMVEPRQLHAPAA
ncbi:MAG: HDOD domain-containing protein [Betaproteobacteria bacterium]|nr:HDOD domain-containing protein [Betaproteobacteria bacterium]